jgi:zona occludens toxin (predicted ATPase)
MLEGLGKLGLQPGGPRARLSKAIEAIPESQREARLREILGIGRAYFGTTRDGSAVLELRDGEGRRRVVIETPKAGRPSIRLLDEHGNATQPMFK